jgi:hypothetical protein
MNATMILSSRVSREGCEGSEGGISPSPTSRPSRDRFPQEEQELTV